MARKLVDADFIDYVGQYDVLFLSETWITNKETYNLDIHLFGNKTKGVKKGRYSGGISVYYKIV